MYVVISPFDMQFDFHVFHKQHLLLDGINHAIYFSQSRLLMEKTNEDQTACWKGLLLYVIVVLLSSV